MNNIEVLDQAFAEVNVINENIKYIAKNLNDLTINKEFEEEGLRLKLSNEAIASLAGLLKIPYSFFKALKKRDIVAWELLTGRLKFVNNKSIVLCYDDSEKEILNIFPGEESYLPIDKAFHSLQLLNEKIEPDFDIKNLQIQKNCIAVDFMSKSADIEILPKDIFKPGFSVVLDHSLITSSIVTFSAERLICSNMATVKQKHYYIYINTETEHTVVDTIYNRYFKKVSSSAIEKLVENIKKMKNINLSLAESEEMYRRLKDIKLKTSDEPAIKDLDTKIPLKTFYDKYGMTKRTNKSHKFRTSARTPLNAYDIYNEVTFQASNNKGVSKEDSLELRILGGSLITRKWDLIDLAPSVTWN